MKVGVREEKVRAVEELSQKLSRAVSVVLTDFRGLDVERMTRLRRMLRDEKVEYKVVRNTFARKAAASAGISGLEKYLEGPTAVALSYDDPVMAAKKLVEFAQENKELAIKAAIVEGRVISGREVEDLAKLPPKPVLLSMVAGSLQVPITRLAYALRAPLGGFAYALSRLVEARQGGS